MRWRFAAGRSPRYRGIPESLRACETTHRTCSASGSRRTHICEREDFMCSFSDESRTGWSARTTVHICQAGQQSRKTACGCVLLVVRACRPNLQCLSWASCNSMHLLALSISENCVIIGRLFPGLAREAADEADYCIR
jgi:hypothetical protein